MHKTRAAIAGCRGCSPASLHVFVGAATLGYRFFTGLCGNLRSMWTRLFISLLLVAACSGCAVVAVADAVVTTGAVIVKTGVKATGAVVGAVIPD